MGIITTVLTSFIVSICTLVVVPYIKYYMEQKSLAYCFFYDSLCKVEFLSSQIARARGRDKGVFKAYDIKDAYTEIKDTILSLYEKKGFLNHSLGKSLYVLLDEYTSKADFQFYKSHEDEDEQFKGISGDDDVKDIYFSWIAPQGNIAKETRVKVDRLIKRRFLMSVFLMLHTKTV